MSEAALALSQSIAAAVERHGPGVVRVEGGDRIPSTGLVWSADGLIVTAHHTVDRDENITVGWADGATAAAKLVGRDPGTDLALLKADATGLTPAAFGDLEGLKVGHLVVALGRPGRSVRAALGIVGTLGDTDGFRTHRGGRVDRYLGSDIRLPPGFDGGPLVDLTGRALGLNTTALLRREPLTVPAATIRRVIERLLARGGARRAYLGVGTYPVRLPPKVAASTGQEGGLLVVSVQPDGPSDKAGVLMGDVLLTLDGHTLDDLGDLLEALDEEQAGRELQARVLRAGQLAELSLTAGARE